MFIKKITGSLKHLSTMWKSVKLKLFIFSHTVLAHTLFRHLCIFYLYCIKESRNCFFPHHMLQILSNFKIIFKIKCGLKGTPPLKIYSVRTYDYDFI